MSLRHNPKFGIFAETPNFNYGSYGGQGSRYGLLYDISFSGTLGAGFMADLINGAKNNATFFNGGQSSTIIHFDFKVSRAINQITWRQSSSDTHGTWVVEGSHDDSSWSSVGSSFTLGGSTAQTITGPDYNATPYRYWRMRQTAGTTNSSPYLNAIEFRIDAKVTKGYHGSYAVGDRTGTITITQANAVGTTDKWVNGSFDRLSYVSGGSAPMHFDFGAPVVLNECLWYQDSNATHGTGQWEGSNDDASWTAIGSTFTVGGGSLVMTDGATGIYVAKFTELNGNTTAYRYYRIRITAGAWSSGPYIEEIEFSVG